MLRPHERALLDSLGLPHDDHARAALNAHFRTETGLRELRTRLADGTYRIDFPEEAALLVVAWLLERDATAEAGAILDAIAPASAHTAFYPVPHAAPELHDERSPEALIEAGVIDSPETLAGLVPRLAAPVATAGVRDPDLRRLAGALDRSLRRGDREDLAALPWGRAILAAGEDAAGVQVAARATLRRVVELSIVHWPHAAIPAPLLDELRPLVHATGLALPLVDADAPSERWLRAIKRACRLVDGTVYATYYGIPCAAIQRLDDPDALRTLAARRAGDETGALEQLQILSTDNVGVLIGALGITPRAAAALPALARRCFTETVLAANDGAIASAATAWRQMLLFLALAPRAAVDEFVMWAGAQVAAMSETFRGRFGPAYAGLCLAVAGMTPGERTAPGARPLIASVSPHWLVDGA